MDRISETDYEKYENRLKTFTDWPNESPALIKELAEAGFYFSGVNDIVKCFACGIEIGNWREEDNPLAKHESASKHCSYLAERARKKAELQGLQGEEEEGPGASSDNSNDVYDLGDFGFDHIDNRKHSVKKFKSNLSNERVEQIAMAGLFYNETAKYFECYCCHIQFDPLELLSNDDPVVLHMETYPSCKHIAIVIDDQKCQVINPQAIGQTREDSGDMRAASVQSQQGPSTGFSKIQESSSCNYSGARKRDVVPTTQQYIQQNTQQNRSSDLLEKTEEKQGNNSRENGLKLKMPIQSNRMQAKTISPDLRTDNQANLNFDVRHGYAHASPLQPPFQKHIDPMPGAMPLDFSGNSSPALGMSPRFSVISGNQMFMPSNVPEFSRQSSNWSMSSDDEIMNYSGFQSSSPLQLSHKKSLLKTKYGRLQTFLTWPQDALIQPQELVEAGFYYTKEDDGVKCFVCGISLKNWEMSDTAWGEHKKWSPNCPLVKEHEVNIAKNNRQPNSLENLQINRQVDRVQHNFYDMGVQTRMPYPGLMPSAPYLLPAARYAEPTNMYNGLPVIGYNNVYQPPINFPNYNATEQREMLRNELPANNENDKETQQVEPIGPLTHDDFDNLLDAGFSVELINTVQKLGLEKYDRYFDSVETVADAIMHYLEHRNLDDHSLPEDVKKAEGESRNEGNSSQNGKQVDLKRELDKVREMQLCKICMDEQVGAAFHPCGHLFTCPKCAEGLQQCPVCRAPIESTSRVYLS